MGLKNQSCSCEGGVKEEQEYWEARRACGPRERHTCQTNAQCMGPWQQEKGMKTLLPALSLVEPEARGTCAACYPSLSHSRSQKSSEGCCLTLEKKIH